MGVENPLHEIREWRLPSSMVEYNTFLQLLKDKRGDDEGGGRNQWYNHGEVSPLTMYCYLKARFGKPNGVFMAVRQPSSDNLVQWDYLIISKGSFIQVIGANHCQYIVVHCERVLSESDWEEFQKNLCEEFRQMAQGISDAKRELEEWTLFVNPYRRLDLIITILEQHLKALKVEEPAPVHDRLTPTETNNYFEAVKRWDEQINEANQLALTLKMTVPVLGESFINLLIYMLAKPEIKVDQRAFDDLIKSQIDIRVKRLERDCEGFIKHVDGNASEFKKFQTVMNQRNDLLHGNADPDKMMFDKVWFDGTIPVFPDDRSLIMRLRKGALSLVDRQATLDDVKVVRRFVEFLLGHLKPGLREKIEIMVKTLYLGWRADRKKVGLLFSETVVESLV
jgi:hypothetical protein